MTTLADVLLGGQNRETFAARVAAELEQHVARIPGLRGVALRTGLKAAKAARPDALRIGVSRLMPLCVEAMEPLYQRSQREGVKFNVFLENHADEATATLMAVIDARADRSRYPAVRALHRRLRGSIEAEMREVLPDFAHALAEEFP